MRIGRITEIAEMLIARWLVNIGIMPCNHIVVEHIGMISVSARAD